MLLFFLNKHNSESVNQERHCTVHLHLSVHEKSEILKGPV